jgi:serine phosphatase RsbU (regulator of sigma subunit)
VSLNLRVALFASVMAIVATAIVSRLEYAYDSEALLHYLGDHITDVAAVTAAAIPGDLHERIVSSAGTEDPTYRRVFEHLKRVRETSTLTEESFFTAIPRGQELVVAVSVPPGPKEGARVPFPPEAAVVLNRGQAGHLHLEDAHGGPTVIAYAPIISSDGRVVAVLVVEAGSQAVEATNRDSVKRFAWFSFLGAVFASTLGLLFVRSLLRPVRTLVGVARRLREGDYETPVAKGGSGEIGMLAATMEEMRQALHQRIHELSNLNLDLARRVQTAIIPRPQKGEWMEVAVAYRPLAEVGGDYASIHFPTPDILYVCIGDVTGHGVPAALLVNRAHSLIDQLVRQQLSPDEVLRQLNAAVLSSFHEETVFMSLLLVNINLSYRQLLFANAGHPAALLLRREGGELRVERLEPQCTVLGVGSELACDVNALGVMDLRAGDRLLLYTDGLIEAGSAPDKLFGEEGVLQALRTHFDLPPQELADGLLAEAAAFAGGELQDDVLVLLIHINKVGDKSPEEAPLTSWPPPRASWQP